MKIQNPLIQTSRVAVNLLHRRGAYLLAGLLACASLPTTTRAGTVQSFCESGFATALQLGAGGAVWTQQWGLPPVDWHDCTSSPNINLLNENVVGRQETVTSGAPALDGNFVLHLPFRGTITLTAYDDEDPELVAGRIVGAMNGTFVADLNAARALVTDTTITIAFGQSVHSAADAVITVTETTGKFRSVQADGDWEWRVAGLITIARVSSLTPQINILAALQNSALILGAEEEVALSGSFVRSAPSR